MKKIIALLFVVVMLLCLSACGDKAPSGSNATSGTQQPNQNSTNHAASGIGGATTKEIENKVELSLDSTHYELDVQIAVTLDFGKLNQETAVIAVVRSDTPHGEVIPYEDDTTWAEYRFLSDFSELPFYLFPQNMGDGLYDVRVYADAESGKELASITIAVGNAVLPDGSENAGNTGAGNTADGGENGILTESGDCTKKQMEDTIVSYFVSISELSMLHLCNGSSITYSKADIPWQTVDRWVINNPEITYDELASSMSSQLIAAGFAEENMSLGGHQWTIAIGDKAMRIELRPEDWAEGGYEIYATPEAE